MNSEFIIAVHSLVFLTYIPGQMATSETIAENVCTHPARIRKVMSCLRKNGFVKTKEGIGGGYILDCNPDEVTLGQVYRAVSCGTLKPGWCSGDSEQACMISSNIKHVMDEVFLDAETQLETYLNGHTVSSILQRIKHCKE
ncbi:Rrf2 family transcriptional regulator [Paenibacillus turpanensis]|uniref:Rrf2 family transcriptional regulator n=1 Tax=Paenibacillus turpanensis TaxID=2689078 RepID=UPI0014076327